MTQVPDGAQRSEDGNYWWDGSAWQLVPQGEQQAGGSVQSDDPLEDEQVRQALTHEYSEVVAYDESHGAELGTEPDESQEA